MKQSLIFVSLLVVCDFLCFGAPARSGQESASDNDFPIKLIKVDGIEFEVLVNSDTFSQASAINFVGSIIGTREVVGIAPGVIVQRSFYYGEVGHKDMPLPESFTNVEATGISDTELVIGYATRPIGHPKGNLDAVLWNPKSDTIVVLPRAEGDSACHAQSISSDGRLIAGYSTGPARLRPVIWMQDEGSQEWRVTLLPTVYENNPFLMSGTLRVSPDGTTIAGCCTEAVLPGGIIDSSLFIWTKEETGGWKHRLFSEHQVYVKGFNNKKQIVGSMRNGSGVSLPCFLNQEGVLTKLDLLPGDISGEAVAINNKSMIVGFSDDPPGEEGGPVACRWEEDGKVSVVRLGEIPYGAVHGINDAGQMVGMTTLVELTNPSDANDGVLSERVLAFRTKRP